LIEDTDAAKVAFAQGGVVKGVGNGAVAFMLRELVYEAHRGSQSEGFMEHDGDATG
jgi:hypothetical protein